MDLAGATATPNPAGPATDPALDGKSFLPELAATAQAPAALGDAWRQHSFSEFFASDITWRLVRVVNSTHKFSYMWWCTNETEVFNMGGGDEWQTTNPDHGGLGLLADLTLAATGAMPVAPILPAATPRLLPASARRLVL